MRILLSLLPFICTCLFFAQWTNPTKPIESIAEAIQHKQRDDYFKFKEEVDSLAAFAQIATTQDIPKLQTQVIKTRLAYKQLEFFIDYLHTKYNYLYINGGPLFKTNEDGKDKPPIAPNGLQTLDELIFSDEVAEELKTIDSLATELKGAVEHIEAAHFSTHFSEHLTIEAIRSGLVRIFTLGLTGFDTPGSCLLYTSPSPRDS